MYIKHVHNVKYYVTSVFVAQENVHDYFIFYAFSSATLVFSPLQWYLTGSLAKVTVIFFIIKKKKEELPSFIVRGHESYYDAFSRQVFTVL